ncbi:MAG: HlyD family efflux transporter periplasmic adaptor subunit [Thermoguttaceae bacterium]|nr:HlyD family efflux transporter periplasmic adaptor subunit [Thermoguttaceae bacterium]
MKSLARVLVFALLIAAVAFGLFKWHAYQLSRDRGADQSLTFYGNVEIRRVNLGFRISGRIEEIMFEEGDRVRKGDKIALLDKAPVQARLDAARAQLDLAGANLELLENGYRKQEIDQARAKLDELRATLVFAEANLERDNSLVGNGGISANDRDKSLSVRDETAAKIAQAEANLSLLEEGYRKEDIAAARAQKAQAEAEKRDAEIALADTELISPSDGILLNRVEETGAVVQNGQTVAILSLDTDVWVYVYVDEPDLGKLSPGGKVFIRTDSSDKVYTGQIGYISPEAEFTPKNVETEKLRTDLVYRVRIIADAPDNGLRQGMPVTVTIPLGESSGSCPALLPESSPCGCSDSGTPAEQPSQETSEAGSVSEPVLRETSEDL